MPKGYKLGGNPIRVSTAETWVVRDQAITIDSIIWTSLSADGTLILAKDSTSAASSNLISRVGQECADMTIIPHELTLSNLYVRTMGAGHIEIFLK
jgi:hypothetical protein